MSSSPAILYLSRILWVSVHDAVFAGIRRYAALRGWEAESVEYGATHGVPLPEILEARRPVGCIVECSNGPPDLPPRLFGRMPVVFSNCVSAPRGRNIARTAIDNGTVAAAAFRELSAGRPDCYAAVGLGEPSMPDRVWSSARVAAFRALCRKERRRCLCLADWGCGAGSPDARLREWIAALPPRTAVFAVNDATAAEVAAAARKAGRPVPYDLTLVGVDNDTAICEASSPPISSIPLDFEGEGFLAARMLGEALANANVANVRKSPMPIADAKQDWKVDLDTGNISTMATLPRSFVAKCASIGPLLVVRRKSTGGRGRHAKLALDAIETIRREACDGLTAAALAKRFNCSRWHLEKRFREATGHSILDEIRHVRLRQVEALLSETDTAIEAIAGMCGFGSEVELRHLFRKRAGMSMREWRKRRRR